jgi:hypothetical protein
MIINRWVSFFAKKSRGKKIADKSHVAAMLPQQHVTHELTCGDLQNGHMLYHSHGRHRCPCWHLFPSLVMCVTEMNPHFYYFQQRRARPPFFGAAIIKEIQA